MPITFKIPEALATAQSVASARMLRRAPRPKPINCLNCGQAITGKFCAQCGQEAEDHRTALWPLISDALNEFARWDSKLFRTVIPLLFRPGFLTNEYNAGRCVRYLSPFRMYLTVSVIFFFFLFQRTHPAVFQIHEDNAKPAASAQKAAINQARIDINQAAAENKDNPAGAILSDSAAAMGTYSQPKSTQSKKIVDKYANVPKLFPSASGRDNTVTLDREVVHLSQLPATRAEYDRLQATADYPYKNKALTRTLIDHFYGAYINKAEFTRKVEDLLPKAMFLLLPIFALVLYLMYLRSRRYYVEHLVYALHNHTFAFTVFTLMLFLPSAVTGWLMLAMAAYLYVSMLTVYRQGWFKTGVKFCILGVSYSMILMLATIATILIAFFMA